MLGKLVGDTNLDSERSRTPSLGNKMLSSQRARVDSGLPFAGELEPRHTFAS